MKRAPPDRRLATKQMSGKKKDKFRITVGLARNSDASGSEKFEPIYTGKSKRPRCFGKVEHGFYYPGNKKAWMTSVLFEEILRTKDNVDIIANMIQCWISIRGRLVV